MRYYALALLLFAATSPISAAALQPGDIVVVDTSAVAGLGAVIKIDAVTGAQQILSSGGMLVHPRGIAIDGNGQVFVADPNAFGGVGGIIRIDPATKTQIPVASGGYLIAPLAVTFDPAGNLIIADAGAPLGTGAIIRVDPATGFQTLVSSGQYFVDPHGVAVAPNGIIFVSEHHIDGGVTGAIVKVDPGRPATANQTVISSGGNLTRCVHDTLDSAEHVIVACLGFEPSGNGIVKVNPSTGAQTVIASGGNLVSPAGVALDLSGNIIVSDLNGHQFPAKVISVEPLTGAQKIVSSGQYFVDPAGIAVVAIPAPGTIQVTTNLPSATFSITGPASFNGSGTSATFSNAPVGAYTIAYGPVAGYATPVSQTLILTGGARISFAGSYVGGTMTINSNLPNATFVLSPSITGVPTGGPYPIILNNVPAGQYAVTFNPIAGYRAPAPSTQSLAIGGLIAFAGEYSPIPQVLIVPGIFGTKLVTQLGTVEWVTNDQLFNAARNSLAGDIFGVFQLYDMLPYKPDGTPIAPLLTGDLFNLTNTNSLTCDNTVGFFLDLRKAAWDIGCARTLNTYNSLIQFLTDKGYSPQSFAYDWRADITSVAPALYNTVLQMVQNNPNRQIAIVAHSLGGLLVGKMFQEIAEGQLPLLPGSVGPIITMGTPFAGSLDSYLQLAGFETTPFFGPATRLIGGNWTAAYELLPRFDFARIDFNQISNPGVYAGLSPWFPTLPRPSALAIADTFWNDSHGGQISGYRIVGSGKSTSRRIQGYSATVTNTGSTIGECRLEVMRDSGDSTVPIDSATAPNFVGIKGVFYVNEMHVGLPSNPAVQDAIDRILLGLVPGLSTSPTMIDPEWEILACSPVTLQVSDAIGNVTNVQMQQVPSTMAFSMGETTQISASSVNAYTVNLVGNAVGMFDLIFDKRDASGNQLALEKFLMIPLLSGSTASVGLSPSGPGLLALDVQGDGIIDFMIPPNAQPNVGLSIQILKSVVMSSGLSHGVANSLSSKLDAAIAAVAQRDSQTAVNVVNAFSNEVSAQNGKEIPSITAAGLLRAAMRIREAL